MKDSYLQVDIVKPQYLNFLIIHYLSLLGRQYCRYADDFLIGVIGSKQDAEQIRDAVRDFLSEQLHLDLSMEKTLITSSVDKANFLGYEVTVSRRTSHFMRRKQGRFRENVIHPIGYF